MNTYTYKKENFIRGKFEENDILDCFLFYDHNFDLL